ncbi:MAG: alpha/beta hydrolase [Pseudomonadota bacterium]|nr:alpha/beta hydrolase [Pseudomonadota bacterium]
MVWISATLDGDTRRLMARIAVDFAGVAGDLDVEGRRALLRAMAEAYGPAPALVGEIEERAIPGPAGNIRVRLYYPKAFGVRPVIVHIHGGGWAIGDPEGYERICRAYCAAARAIVVDVDYRRAPENKFPAALDDCVAALKWAAANAAALGGDPARIAVAGDSAGGNLAAAAVQQARGIAALQVLVYPVISASPSADFASRRQFGDGRYFLRHEDIANAEREYLKTPEQGDRPEASPILAEDLSGLPPALIITAAFDPLRDEGAAYAKLLKRAGVKVRYYCAPRTIHAFVLFAGAIGKGRRAIARIGRAVRGMPKR